MGYLDITREDYEELKQKAKQYGGQGGSALKILGRDVAKNYIEAFLSNEISFDRRQGGVNPIMGGLQKGTPLYIHWSIIKSLDLSVEKVSSVTEFLESAFEAPKTIRKLLTEMVAERRVGRIKNEHTRAWHYGSAESFLDNPC